MNVCESGDAGAFTGAGRSRPGFTCGTSTPREETRLRRRRQAAIKSLTVPVSALETEAPNNRLTLVARPATDPGDPMGGRGRHRRAARPCLPRVLIVQLQLSLLTEEHLSQRFKRLRSEESLGIRRFHSFQPGLLTGGVETLGSAAWARRRTAD